MDFSAAYPEALLSFEDRYPGARVLLMETNYRSDAGIVAAADAFIRQNSLRHENICVLGTRRQARSVRST